MTTSRLVSKLVCTVSALAALSAVTGCSTAPPVGPIPGSTVAAEPAADSSTSPVPALKIEINIDQKTVTPLQKEYDLSQGQTVVLVTRSDHDTTLTVTGAGIDKADFIGRLTTIPTTFVADTPGVILIESTDPVATIARLNVG